MPVLLRQPAQKGKRTVPGPVVDKEELVLTAQAGDNPAGLPVKNRQGFLFVVARYNQ